jgi:GNAT superfamily N-acetyltransferase
MTDDAPATSRARASLEFYRDGLGLDTRGVVATEFTGDEPTPQGAIAIFERADGLLLALYPRTELAKDANI